MEGNRFATSSFLLLSLSSSSSLPTSRGFFAAATGSDLEMRRFVDALFGPPNEIRFARSIWLPFLGDRVRVAETAGSGGAHAHLMGTPAHFEEGLRPVSRPARNGS